jgi:hypothetical protein
MQKDKPNTKVNSKASPAPSYMGLLGEALERASRAQDFYVQKNNFKQKCEEGVVTFSLCSNW